MRIFAGEKKGHSIVVPKMEFRPTQGKVREALFNIVDVDGMRMLDIYTGSGAIGLEALSHGAAQVTFVDIDKRAVIAISESLVKLGYTDRGHVIRNNSLRFLASPSGPYDIIYADPPYDTEDLPEILSRVRGNGLLTDDGILVIEMNRRAASVIESEAYDLRRYGKALLAFFRKAP
ncbi:MAG: 16S rRNA (guanine(966)-N(2))-methyltransferase RsmD [Spirochaetota bacterium]